MEGVLEGGENKNELKSVLGNVSTKCHSINYGMIEEDVTACVLPFKRARAGHCG